MSFAILDFDPRLSTSYIPTLRAIKSLAATGGHVLEIVALLSVSAPLYLHCLQALMILWLTVRWKRGSKTCIDTCSTPVVKPHSRSQYHGSEMVKRDIPEIWKAGELAAM